MVEITYQMVLSTLQTAGIFMGIIYYIFNMRNQQRTRNLTLRAQEQTLKTRHATIYYQIMSSILSPAGVKNISLLDANPVSSFEEYQKLIRSNNEFYEAWLWMCNIYEMTGVYLRQGGIDIDHFALHNPYWNLWFWRQAKPIIYKQRERLGPSHFRNMEYAFDSLEKYFEEHPELAP